MCLRKSEILPEKINRTKRQLINLLDASEKVWVEKQEMMLNEILQQNFQKALLFEEKANMWIREAKSKWNGPLTSVDDLNRCCRVKRTEKDMKALLKMEIRIKKFLSPRDAVNRKKLYALNCLSVEQLKLNLLTLLETPYQKRFEGTFPDEHEITQLINSL